jgi:hypothetical protein
VSIKTAVAAEIGAIREGFDNDADTDCSPNCDADCKPVALIMLHGRI